MAAVSCESHVAVLATRLKGEVSWAPLEGEVTVIADAGATAATSVKKEKKEVFMDVPRVRICLRAFVCAVAAAGLAEDGTMSTIAVIALEKFNWRRRITFSVASAFAVQKLNQTD